MRLNGSFFAVLLLAGLAAPGIVVAQDEPVNRAAMSHPYSGHVAEAAHRFGIPEAWIWAVMRVESGGRRNAVSRAGAMGLMQIMPGTWAQLRARHRLGSDPFDPRDNILAGAAYLRAMYNRYGNVTAMLAAYNAGPGRYDQYLRGRPLPAETRAYLAGLSSISGTSGDVQVTAAAPSDPHAWRQAGLFVRTASPAELSAQPLSNDVIVASDNVRESQPEREPTIRDDAATPTSPASSDTLFVRRAGAGRPQ
ncbi:lytic transglycosylase domain-containing protein [Qipengyuania qiaonensis]|uniref:Lytic transglycosylase domain-containing protein n=1 Tax=Qipengyuania qiaonensis TaxID=2867240 RepID=A0ABS7J3W5_9SPHN|nr:lytic transglycosylase domain-containing protein [Qipengyuania qiaonensis]MBX7482015.1 lytic transglycosylase domain-containing protein [Qipengyuania qiaonensis]